MLLAYFDDSGEPGVILLAAVLVRDTAWINVLDAWSDYRQWLRADFGLPIFKGSKRHSPVELHATEIVSGAGAWRHLSVSKGARVRAFQVGLRLIGRHARVFAVAWDTNRPVRSPARQYDKPVVECWTVALERLATYSIRSADHDRVMAFTDSGYGDHFTKVFRRMRRHHYVGSMFGGPLAAAAPMFVDDPVVRDSKNSAFIQMADLCAYAALHELRPRPAITGGLWQHLGAGVLREVNRNMAGQPPGIKLLPP